MAIKRQSQGRVRDRMAGFVRRMVCVSEAHFPGLAQAGRGRYTWKSDTMVDVTNAFSLVFEELLLTVYHHTPTLLDFVFVLTTGHCAPAATHLTR